jgi:hypothetical protein
MKIIHFLAAAVLLTSSTALRADGDGIDIKPYLAYGLDFAQGHSLDLTQKTFGGINSFTAEFGFQFLHQNSGLHIRPNIGIAKILSGDPTESMPIVYDLMGIYGGVDVVYTPWRRWPVLISTGPSFHVWNVDEQNTIDNPSQGQKGLKLGWRLGAGYEVNSKLRVELTYTLTEWRSNGELPYIQGWNPSSPSYFCLKASYSF